MTADALATSFMVMGLEPSKELCAAHPDIEAYFIYTGEDGKFKTFQTEGMNKFMQPDQKK